MRIHYGLIFLTIFLIQCSPKKGDEQRGSKTKVIKDGLVKTYHPNGKVKTEVNVKGGKRNGKATEYYSDGKKLLEITYVDGQNHGLTRRYYPNGNLSEETMYEKGQMHGLRKKYRQNGKLSAEAMYNHGQPCTGLKEYLVDGKPKKNYPTIVIEPIDRILKENKYVLRLSLSDKSRNVMFYRAKLTNNCMTDDFEFMTVQQPKNGVGELEIELSPGTFVMQEVNIIAKVKTALGNYYITQRSYHLAIENR